jgi:hypothetical protein
MFYYEFSKGVAQQPRPGEEIRGKDEFEILRHTVLLLLLLLSMFIGEFWTYSKYIYVLISYLIK